MNDISVKIEESLKDQPVVEETPAVEQSGENEVDPLAIDEGEAVSGKSPETDEAPVVKTEEEDNAGNCDENAKEVNLEEKNDGDETLTENAEKVQDEPLKDDKLADTPVAEDDSEKPKTVVDEPQPIIESNPEPAEEAPKSIEVPVDTEVVSDTVTEIPKAVTPKPLSPPNPPKEPSPPKEVPVIESKESAPPEKKAADIEMIEVPPHVPPAPSPAPAGGKEKEKSTPPPPINGDVQSKEDQSSKRRASEDIETDSPLKRLCQEVEKTFPQHDTMINDYIQTATKNNIDEIQRHTEQLLSEIQTLRELAQKKEHEWNNILHLKKVKEEILLRLLRRKQVLSFEKSAEINGAERTDPFDYLNQAKNLAIDKSDEISGLSLKQPGSTMSPMMQGPVMPVNSPFNPMAGLPPPYDKAAHMQPMPKPVYPQAMMMPGPMPGSMPGFPRDMNGQLPGNFGMPMGRQGPTKDVKSIIADYRQRNPDITPRRGRRMKSILNPNMMNPPRPIAPKMDNINSMNNMLFNNLDMNQKAMLERLQQIQAGGLLNGVSFKDVLVQYANMQQGPGLMPGRPMEMNRAEHHIRPEGRRRQERNHEEPHASTTKQAERMASSSPRLPPPPPYPEISLLPVTTSQETATSQSQQNSLLHGILTKNCGEITITPVQPIVPPEPQPEKADEVVQLDDEESAASSPSGAGSPSGSGSGRLVIDEGGGGGGGGGAGAGAGAGGGEEAEEGGEAPLCQGCRRRDAQFVCAGCANQWYCSRDCQVAAWDEHSEMCSG
ncbi:titin-like isoform X2 [Plodia interpunctella]|uniref:titin-like isoform X2 n=1 Tax=Plodia interpunctella TaxID=58824 RepID=UPI0023679DB0|nr:titin-like isoform X2 [Plodia interpunctella]